MPHKGSLWYMPFIMVIIGVHMHVNESDATDIQADIEGPIGTPY